MRTAAAAARMTTSQMRVRLVIDTMRADRIVDVGSGWIHAEAGATFVTVSASREDDRLVIEVGDDGRERTAPLIEVDDRVGAIGGSADTGPTSLRAVLPCA